MTATLDTGSPVERLLALLPDARETGSGWSARCPAHEDRHASLSVGEGDDGRALVRCHAGCDVRDICAALGITTRALMASTAGDHRRNGRPARNPVTVYPTAAAAVAELERRHGPRSATWTFHDAAGDPVGLVVRWDRAVGKDVRPVARHQDGWRIGAMPAPRPLYRLPELGGAGLVVVAEGERCADAARGLGYTATTSAGGARAASRTDWSPLAGRDVWILPDHDEPGRRYAADVAEALGRLTPPARVTVVALPGLPDHGDVVDWIDAHGDAVGPDDLRRELEALAGATGRGGAASCSTATAADPPRLTDVGNGRRLARRHGDDLRYCSAWRQWLTWDGRRWATDETGAVERLAKGVVREMYAEAADESLSPDERKALATWSLRSEEARRIRAMIDMARSEPGIPITPDQLDRDPMLLGVGNGTIDLRTGRLRPHERADLMTRMTPVEYHPDARCPTWERCLSEWMGGRTTLTDYLRRVVGYSLTGDVREQCLFFLFGGGANGKSTYLDIILALMGAYGGQAVSELLMVRHGETHPAERADLFGRRVVACVETEEGRRLAESLLKQLTGGDRIRARRLYENLWEFAPTHKLYLAANHKPVVRGSDHAIWRRIKLIPFTVTFEAAARDSTLSARLKDELPGILAWAVRGCQEWLRDGLREPEEVREATTEYRSDMDVVARYLDEQCVIHREYRVLSRDLYADYRRWAEEGRTTVLTRDAFGRRLSDRGYATTRTGRDKATAWIGLRLRESGQ